MEQAPRCGTQRDPDLTYLDEPRLYVFIVQKLREDEEFLAQELVGEIHCGVHDP